MAAAQNGQVAAIECLLNGGADVNARSTVSACVLQWFTHRWHCANMNITIWRSPWNVVWTELCHSLTQTGWRDSVGRCCNGWSR
jgi:hypothetical protein